MFETKIMSLRAILICFLFYILPSVTAGQGYFEPNEDIAEAYKLVSSLRFDEARIKIDEIKYHQPDNLLVYHIENYIDFFTLFINENKDEFDRLEKNKDIRIKKINKGDKESPYYLFIKAEINLQWATARLKFGETTTPLLEVYRAFKLLEKNTDKFPYFIENKKSLSIIHAISESIPGAIRFVFNVKGSIEQGTAEINDVIKHTEQHGFLYSDEAYAINAYILFFQNNKKKEAYDLLFNADLDHSTSPLLCFLKANIAQKNGFNEQAIQILEERPKGDEYFDFPYLDFMYGKFKLYTLDKDANRHMLKFLEDFKGRHYIKEAYQKLAWYELAQNEDISAYKHYMKLCQEEGYALVDEDKQALKESEDKKIPNATLLRARLLFDGGYYSKAYGLLAQKSYQFTDRDDDRLEFNYRMGRISHELQNYPDAIEFYLLTLDEGKKKKSFMSCNAALQIALILEGQKKYKQSKQYYERCLDISPSEYKTSLHQKAESGLERVSPFVN